MSRVRNSKRVARPRRKPRKPRAKNQKRKTRKVKRTLSPLLTYAKCILDPCHGPITPAPGLVVPGQTLDRFRSSFQATVSVNDGSGYFVWYPSFHGDSTSGGLGSYNGSLYNFGSGTVTSTVPTNSTTAPMGKGAEGSTGLFQADPVNISLGAGSPFTRATTLSACMQLEWLGKLSDIQGQVAIVQNYPLSAFFSNTGDLITNANPPKPPSVDQIFNYASVRERFSVSGHEVIWRPTSSQTVPRTGGDEFYGSTAAATRADTAFWCGDGSTTVTRVSCPEPSEAYGICIAWKGTGSGSLMQVNCIKTVSLELGPRNSQIELPPQYQSPASMASKPEEVTNFLDSMGDWQIDPAAVLSKITGIDDVSTAVGTSALLTVLTGGNTAMNAAGSAMRTIMGRPRQRSIMNA